MTVTININGLTLCHRASEGITDNTLPDVCKTPSGGVPIPYKNRAFSRDLVMGTTTVFADGGNMIANYGSNFCKSIFDEPGSMGGVISGTYKAEADWITHSFDVFFEKKAACRLTDKMFHNHHNTVNMAGLTQKALAALRRELQKFICDCDKEVKPGPDDNCMSLGNKKHDCVEKKKEEANKKRAAEGKPPAHGGEKGYKVDENGKIVRENGKPKVDDIAGRRAQKAENVSKARAVMNKATGAVHTAKAKLGRMQQSIRGRGRGVGSAGSSGIVGSALGDAALAFLDSYLAKQAEDAAKQAAEEAAKAAKEVAKAEAEEITRRSGYKYPDGTILDEDGKIREISEYKFRCPKGTPTGGKNKAGVPSVSRGNGTGKWGKGQKESYEEIQKGLKGKEATQNVDLKKYDNLNC